VESAWDTAFGQRQSEALTVDITGLFVPCNAWHRNEDPDIVGPCDFHFDVFLLDMFADTLDFRELALAFRTRYGLWGPRRVTVEEKASGISLLQTFRGSAIPLRGQKVAEGKIDRAINPVFSPTQSSIGRSPGVRAPHGVGGGAASVQGWARMGRILYPAGAPWTQPSKTDPTGRPGWLHRMLNFSGGTRNADEFDATVHLITRAITLSVRSGRLPSQVGESFADNSGVVPDYLTDPYAGAREALAAIAGLQAPSPQATANSLSDPASNPFHGFCGGGCGSYKTVDNRLFCIRHGRSVSAFDGCGDWSVAPPAPEVTPAWDNLATLT
jgi:hypothetical protein